MQFRRSILALAVLALYVVQLLGGRAVHWSLCSAGSPCCGANTAEEHASEHLPRARCHGGCDRCLHREPSDGAPADGKRHNSSKCWVCQVLAQAQERPLELTLWVELARSYADFLVIRDVVCSPDFSGFRTRAPPA